MKYAALMIGNAEVDYDGYERVPYVTDGWTKFPYCTHPKGFIHVTHFAIMTDRTGGSLIEQIALDRSYPVGRALTVMVRAI